MVLQRIYGSTALTHISLLITLMGGWSANARANPEDGVVSAGSAIISSSGKKLDVHQQSNNVVIDWRSFNIDVDEHTQFYQPSSGSIALNRVNSADPSYILGKLTANGNVILINPNGVMFGAGSRVDVNGLVATTADIKNENFMAGHLRFDKAGNPNAAIVNQGHITAKEAGLVGLIAPNVINNGVIEAKLGKIHLAGGDTATVDLYGDGLMEVAVSDDVQSQLVINTGSLSAAGGSIAMTASAGKNIVDNLVAVKGELKAPAVGVKNGRISIFAEGKNAVKGNVASDKGLKTGSSNVVVQASLDVSGLNAGERGGAITVTGDNVAIMNGTIMNASGRTGKTATTEGKLISDVREGSAGGDIRIGGDYLGQGNTATAENLFVDTYTLFYNDALDDGDAGRTIFWSDNDTIFKGNVYARGGVSGGNGGFLETSGHNNLVAQGFADLTAENGKKGTYFLDPTNITIYGNFDPGAQAGGVAWYDAADESSLIKAGTSISGWNDKIGINQALTSFGSQAQWINNGLNNRGVVRFDGNGTLINTTFPDFNDEITVYWAGTINTNSADGLFELGTGAYNSGYNLIDWGNMMYWRTTTTTGAQDVTQTFDIPGSYIYTGLHDGATTSMFKNNTFAGGGPAGALLNTITQLTVGGLDASSYRGPNDFGELIIFNQDHDANTRLLMNQYLSAKWNIQLDPIAGAGLEASEAMDATNGYSLFTTRYLERLSQTADISLQASADIIFDLKGDTLALQADRNLTLTAGNDIKTTSGSAGMIETTRTGSGGNITMTATRDIDLKNITLKTNNGNIDLNAGRDVSLSTAINTGSGSLDVDGQNISIYGGGVAGMPNLVAFYRFDEGAGSTLNDLSGYGNNGTLVNGPTWTSLTPGALNGNGSLQFDGSNDYVTVADSNSLDLTNGFTISLWMKSDNNAQTNRYLLSKTNNAISDNVYSVLYGYAADQTQFYASGNGYGYPSGSSNMSVGDGNWHQMTYTYDGSTYKSYKDGVLVGSTTLTANLTASTASLLLGSFNGAGYHFQGSMDDVRIYNTALSSNEVSRLAAPVTWQTGSTTLNATNNVSFDLKGDVLNSGSTTVTAGNNISSAGNGRINTAGAGNTLLTAGSDINIAHDLDINALGSGSVTLRSGNSISYSGSGDITTQGGGITLNSDYHATTPNNLGSIALGSGTTLTSNNGNIILGGGVNATGYAYGTSGNGNGIELNAATITSGTGSITMRGNGYTGGSVANEHGIWIQGNSAVNSTSGAMNFYGRGGSGTVAGHDGWGNLGFYLLGSNIVSTSGDLLVDGVSGTGNLTWNTGSVVYTGASMRTAGNGTINFTGTNNSGVNSNQVGVWLGSSNGYIESQNGAITINSTASTNSAGSYGLYLSGSTNGVRTTGSGAITVNSSAALTNGDIYYGSSFAFGSGTASGNITINANNHNVVSAPTITTTGNVTFAPRTAATTIGVAGGAGTMSVPAAMLDNITASNLIIGRSDGASILTVGARNWGARNYNLRLLNGTGRIAFASGSHIMGNRTLFAQNLENIRFQAGSSLASTAAGDAIVLVAGSYLNNMSGSATPITVTGGGRWLAYMSDPAGNTFNGMTSAFHRYSCTYGGSCPALDTGNGFLYANTPLLTITPDAAAIDFNDPVPAFTYTLSGYLGSDSGLDLITGTPVYNTAYMQGDPAGAYNITGNIGTLVSSMGYGFSSGTKVGGLTVNPAPLPPAPATNNVTVPNTVTLVSQVLPPVYTSSAGPESSSSSGPSATQKESQDKQDDVLLAPNSAKKLKFTTLLEGLLKIDPELEEMLKF